MIAVKQNPKVGTGCRQKRDSMTPRALAVGVESLNTGTWAAYSKTWQELKELLEVVGPTSGKWESCLLYFIGSGFSHRVFSSGMGRKQASLAFWFKFREEQDFTKSFLEKLAMKKGQC